MPKNASALPPAGAKPLACSRGDPTNGPKRVGMIKSFLIIELQLATVAPPLWHRLCH
jgi:hypothetical protein